MTSITAMKNRLSQLDLEKAALLAKVSTTARKNSDARKYALGGALLKIAATDAESPRGLAKGLGDGSERQTKRHLMTLACPQLNMLA